MNKGNRVRKRVDEICDRMEQLSKAHYEYLKLSKDLDTIQLHSCPHAEAYWLGTQSEGDSYEGRTYDNIYCPDCHLVFEERCYAGQHKYPKKV